MYRANDPTGSTLLETRAKLTFDRTNVMEYFLIEV